MLEGAVVTLVSWRPAAAEISNPCIGRVRASETALPGTTSMRSCARVTTGLMVCTSARTVWTPVTVDRDAAQAWRVISHSECGEPPAAIRVPETFGDVVVMLDTWRVEGV